MQDKGLGDSIDEGFQITSGTLEKDMYFTGGTVIFDHGHGISTLYMHMKDINVQKGQKVKKGQIVGTLGQSGRATGPHLDIRLNWFEIKLDPMTILN